MKRIMFAMLVGALCFMGQRSVRAEEIIIEPRVRPEVVVPVPVEPRVVPVPVPSCRDNYEACTKGCEDRYTSPSDSSRLRACVEDCKDTYSACKDE